MTYSEKLKNPKWQKKRLEIFERDGWACQICLRQDKTLNVHHHRYEPGKQPWEYENENFVTLCEGCHKIIESMEPLHRRLIFQINELRHFYAGIVKKHEATVREITGGKCYGYNAECIRKNYVGGVK